MKHLYDFLPFFTSSISLSLINYNQIGCRIHAPKYSYFPYSAWVRMIVKEKRSLLL
jgi:hypothetical protein